MKKFFQGISKKLNAHAEDITSSFGHKGEQGSSNERALIEFLEKYLPKRYAVGRGKILAHNEEDTDQIDTIIYDNYRNPPLYTENGFLAAAIESVYGVIEVKTTLNKTQLLDANGKSKSVLTKPRLSSTVTNRSPGVLFQSSGETVPPVAACFAFRGEASIESVARNLADLEEKGELYLDLVCILDQGIAFSRLLEITSRPEFSQLDTHHQQAIRTLQNQKEHYESMGKSGPHAYAMPDLSPMLKQIDAQIERLHYHTQISRQWVAVNEPDHALLHFLIKFIEYLDEVPDRHFHLSDYFR